MKLILTASIRKAEFEPLQQTFPLNVIKIAGIMLRLKNDKKIGENMSIDNRKFKKVFDKNLSLLINDIEHDDYEEFRL